MGAGQVGSNPVSDDDRSTTRHEPLGRAHREQLADFIEAVNSGGAVRVGTREGRAAGFSGPMAKHHGRRGERGDEGITPPAEYANHETGSAKTGMVRSGEPTDDGIGR